jgi:hypothetical protein
MGRVLLGGGRRGTHRRGGERTAHSTVLRFALRSCRLSRGIDGLASSTNGGRANGAAPLGMRLGTALCGGAMGVLRRALPALIYNTPTHASPISRAPRQTFCVWQHAVPLLESHTVIFPDETRCFDSLAEMYRLVGGFINSVLLNLEARQGGLVRGFRFHLCRRRLCQKPLPFNVLRRQARRKAYLTSSPNTICTPTLPFDLEVHLPCNRRQPPPTAPPPNKAPRGGRVLRRLAQALRGAQDARSAVPRAARPVGRVAEPAGGAQPGRLQRRGAGGQVG